MTQRTLVLLKPDAVRRGLVGEVLGRFEAKGLSIVAMEHRTIDAAQADRHYAEHVDKDFYPPLRDFVTSGPLVALVLEGDEAVEVVRAANGATDGRKAAPGTIRGDLSLSNRENLGARLGLPGVGRPGDRDLVPRAGVISCVAPGDLAFAELAGGPATAARDSRTTCADAAVGSGRVVLRQPRKRSCGQRAAPRPHPSHSPHRHRVSLPGWTAARSYAST